MIHFLVGRFGGFFRPSKFGNRGSDRLTCWGCFYTFEKHTAIMASWKKSELNADFFMENHPQTKTLSSKSCLITRGINSVSLIRIDIDYRSKTEVDHKECHGQNMICRSFVFHNQGWSSLIFMGLMYQVYQLYQESHQKWMTVDYHKVVLKTWRRYG